MSDRISPPTWTEWTRNPSERSSSRKAFDDILGDLRKDGLIEARGSLFVHLARYSYLHVKNARIDVKNFIQSVPDDIFRQVSPTYRISEVESVLRILVAAGLANVEEENSSALVKVVLTERKAAGEVARGQEVQAILAHLKKFYGSWDTAVLVGKPSSFPTPDSTAKATGVDRAHLTTGAGCIAVQDKPESNETNESPFLQETVDQGSGPLVLLQFWPLPDPKSAGAGIEPEFSLLIPSDLPLAALVKEYALPLLGEFFRSNDHHAQATEIQTKYANYMHKYREKFSSASGIPTADRVDKVLALSDPEGEAFANAIYVVAQVLRALGRGAGGLPRAAHNPVVYQAARIAYAHAMAHRVRKRRAEREATGRVQDAGLLVARLKESLRPLTIEELKRTPDVTKNKEIGAKYAALIELLPLLPPREGARPAVYEIRGAFIHREHLLRTFLEFREREAIAQRERLAKLWARYGIPPVEDLFLSEKDVSAEFLRCYELIHQERLVAAGLPDFIRDFVPNETDVYKMAPLLWPDGHKGAVTANEVVSRGLDLILYEDKERLRRRPLVGVLGLARVYPLIVKDAWNTIFLEDGLFRFILRKLAAFFGGKASAPAADNEAKIPKSGSSAGASGTKGSSVSAGQASVSAQKAADLKKLKELAPLLKDREALVQDREKAASQWCLKLDPEANRRTRQAVDDEVARLVPKIVVEQLSEENGARVALFLVEKSSVLEQVTSSRAFHRYLYLTALLRKADTLGR